MARPTSLANPYLNLAVLAVLVAGAPHLQAQPRPAPPSELVGTIESARAACGRPAGAQALQPVDALHEAARRIEQGAPGPQALKAAGYRSKRMFQIRMSGHPSIPAVGQALAQAHCQPLRDARFSEVGVYRQGTETAIVLAEPFDPPPPSAAGDVAARVLALTNQARAEARRCGQEAFGAAGPLRPNPQLDQAARAHAQDMARHSFMAHEGRNGSEPSQRISQAGYAWRAIGENVAAGQTTAEQVVRDWVRSPEHCANLMSPEFTEMGIAFATNPGSEGGVYWTQTFGRPR